MSTSNAPKAGSNAAGGSKTLKARGGAAGAANSAQAARKGNRTQTDPPEPLEPRALDFAGSDEENEEASTSS